MTEALLAEALLADLRTLLGEPGLTYAEAPTRLMGGYDTTILAFRLTGAHGDFAGPLVARIFGEQGGSRATGEGALQAAIAAQGYPVPRPLHICASGGSAGRPYLVMPRVPGGTLMTAGLWRMPGILASAHAALHALDPAPIREALREAGPATPPSGLADWLDALREDAGQPGMESLQPAFAWLDTHRPAAGQQAICHLDFHPLNILYHEGAVSGVIDWGNTALGDPAADVAVTRVILTEAPMDVPRLLGPIVQGVRHLLAWRYTRAYRRLRPFDSSALGYYEALRCFRAMCELSRRRLAERAGQPGNATGYAWSDPVVVKRLTRRFQRITGTRLVPVPEARN